MAEYIRREDAIKCIEGQCVDGKMYGNDESDEGTLIEAYSAIDDLMEIPPADVAPVRHGRWVDRIVDENEVIQPWMKRYYCSECLEGGNQSWFKFCPNCGAKMDGGDGNSDMV